MFAPSGSELVGGSTPTRRKRSPAVTNSACNKSLSVLISVLLAKYRWPEPIPAATALRIAFIGCHSRPLIEVICEPATLRLNRPILGERLRLTNSRPMASCACAAEKYGAPEPMAVAPANPVTCVRVLVQPTPTPRTKKYGLLSKTSVGSDKRYESSPPVN